MGILNAIQGTRVYLDTNIWIYALEGYPAFVQNLTQLFQNIEQGNLSVITSELSLAEALVKPFQNQDLAQQKTYKQFISNSRNLTVIPVSRQVLIEAAQLRASVNIKLPDAIYAATALLSQCSTFLTNDQRFESVPSLSVVVHQPNFAV
ncbi:type II toxin-antitoxin system VapC family toxin [Komarekiella sp. 'clone 1']|uniref:Type II toxin-antitoxin system VapC family toxin n=1 Tax=Komarekiella delphini-convector SJRDD-AB1 TaxID=2593771 RepID=A0AA40VR78_9NOST|nr:PIN domain-containing protein [Komarekiella delphini-convector]MBD6616934.1 type II toxin-antitoxin system VapC family toxin [Komarekiella delphini-convector SJRDD-AB1]